MNKNDLFNAEQLRDNIAADCDYLMCLYYVLYGDVTNENEQQELSSLDQDGVKYVMRKTVNIRAIAFIQNLRGIDFNYKSLLTTVYGLSLVHDFISRVFNNFQVFIGYFYDLALLNNDRDLYEHINKVFQRIKYNFDYLTTEYVK